MRVADVRARAAAAAAAVGAAAAAAAGRPGGPHRHGEGGAGRTPAHEAAGDVGGTARERPAAAGGSRSSTHSGGQPACRQPRQAAVTERRQEGGRRLRQRQRSGSASAAGRAAGGPLRRGGARPPRGARCAARVCAGGWGRDRPSPLDGHPCVDPPAGGAPSIRQPLTMTRHGQGRPVARFRAHTLTSCPPHGSGAPAPQPRALRASAPTTWAPPSGASSGWPTRRPRTSRRRP